MSDTFFISDSHFFHANILKYEPIARPFSCLEEMHEAMIERWNSVVKKHDKVYHCGDFCFGRNNIAIADRLNGNKRLILGNHDCYRGDEYLKHFKSIHGALFLGQYLLTHIPAHPTQLENRARFNIHGHTHSICLDDKRYINVSVEQCNLTPINIEELHT